MNGEGDGKVTVRYDPDLATTRRERDDLRLELAKRESKEKDLIKRVRKLERRLNDVTGDDEKITKLRQQLLKKEKHIDGLQKYLRKLPTIDEYSQCLSEKDSLKIENQTLAKRFSEIKEQLGPYIQKVKVMKKTNLELEDELTRVKELNASLEDKICIKGSDSNDSGKENKSESQLIGEIEQQKTIETNLLIRLKKEREERALEHKRLNEEIESQSKSIATLMEETKAKNDELQRVNEQVTKFEALHEELKKEIILLTGEAGPDKIREEFQTAVEEFQSVVDLTLEQDSVEDFDILHQTCRTTGLDKTLPQIMDQLRDIRQTVLDMHANLASQKCQVQ